MLSRSFLCFLMWFLSESVLACQCKDQNIDINCRNSDMVVYATIQDFIASPSADGGTAVLAIDRWWKSSSPRKIVTNSLTSCGLDFETGDSWLLFLNKESNGLFSTDRCSGNKKLEPDNRLNQQLKDLKNSNLKTSEEP